MEEVSSTTVVHPGQRLEVGSGVVTIDSEEDEDGRGSKATVGQRQGATRVARVPRIEDQRWLPILNSVSSRSIP